MTTLASRPATPETSATPPVPTPRRVGRPLRPRDFGWADAGVLAAAAVSSLALVWVVFYQLTLLSGIFGFLVCWYLGFLALTWMVTSQLVDRRAATDRVVTVVMCTGAVLVFGIVFFIVGWVVAKGARFFHLNLIYKDQKNFQPANTNALSQIGVAHQIVGTFEEVGIAALIGVPIAIATAVFLNEVKGRGVRAVRTVITAMSALPSVVAGIFIFSIFVEPSLINYCGLLAGIALFILILPSVTRTTEEVLRIVPGGLREASLALGASEFRTVVSVVLPTARSGIITASLLGTAIAAGETAPLIFTSFGSSVMNLDPFHGAQGALPLGIYINIRQPQTVLQHLAFVTAFILLVVVGILFVSARIFGRQRATSGRVRRRLSAMGRSLRQRRNGADAAFPLAAPTAGPAPTASGGWSTAADTPTTQIPPIGSGPPTIQIPPAGPSTPTKERPDP